MAAEEKYDPVLYFTDLAKGDYKALEGIYYTYKHPLALFLRRYVLDDPLAIEIIISELLVLLWEKRESVIEKQDPVRWMFGIAQKTAWKYVSQSRRYVFASLEGTEFKSALYNAEDRIVRQELAQRIRDAIERLPVQERRVLLLKIEEQLSNEQIANRLQISRQTVKNELHRARKKIMELLGYMVIGILIEILKSY